LRPLTINAGGLKRQHARTLAARALSFVRNSSRNPALDWLNYQPMDN
jgi:hypothetical protein